MVQSFYKNWLLVLKITWGIWTTSHRQWKVQSWNLMGYFCPKNTFLQLEHYIPKIYLTLLSTTCVKILQITHVSFETIYKSFFTQFLCIFLAQTLHINITYLSVSDDYATDKHIWVNHCCSFSNVNSLHWQYIFIFFRLVQVISFVIVYIKTK